MAGFGISGIEPSGSTIRQVISWLAGQLQIYRLYLDASLVRVDVTCCTVLGGPVVAAAAGLLRDRVANPCSTSALVELCGRLLGPAAKQQMHDLHQPPIYDKLK